MKSKLIIGLTGIAIFSMLFVGCSKVPKVEIDAANTAIEKAAKAGADIYLTSEYTTLKDTMAAIMQKVEEQKSMSGNYASIKEKLIELTNHAMEMEQKAVIRKDSMHKEINTVMTEVKELIEENGKLVLSVSEKNKKSAEFIAIIEERNVIKGMFNESNALLRSENYILALSKAKLTKEKALIVNKNLQEVLTKNKSKLKSHKAS